MRLTLEEAEAYILLLNQEQTAIMKAVSKAGSKDQNVFGEGGFAPDRPGGNAPRYRRRGR